MMCRPLIAAMALIAGQFCPDIAVAESLGVYGPVWDIAEPDAIDLIKSTLRKQNADGTIQRMWDQAQRKALDRVEHPEPVSGVTTATEHQIRTFDPTFTFTQTVLDHLGNVVVPAGTRINPLDYISLTKAYIYIDGRDEAQVRFAKSQLDANPLNRVVLTAGSFVALSRAWGLPVYFDQKGVLTRHFGITRVPAVLTQKGKLLQIEELPQ